MDAIDRRSALRSIMCAAVTAGFSTTLLTGVANAVPLALEKDLGEKVEAIQDKAQPVQSRRPPRRPVHRRHIHRRRRRRVCWWRNGRRVCVWR